MTAWAETAENRSGDATKGWVDRPLQRLRRVGQMRRLTALGSNL
jgi:hypothetical protein